MNIDSILDMSKGLLEIPLNEEILSRTPPEAIALILHLLERVSKLEAQNAALEKRIVELEARVNRKSSNSNNPPSSDSPYENKTRFSSDNPNEKRDRRGICSAKTQANGDTSNTARPISGRA